MCLIVDNKEYEIAKEDIVCYKMLEHIKEKGIYVTAYIKAPCNF